MNIGFAFLAMERHTAHPSFYRQVHLCRRCLLADSENLGLPLYRSPFLHPFILLLILLPSLRPSHPEVSVGCSLCRPSGVLKSVRLFHALLLFHQLTSWRKRAGWRPTSTSSCSPSENWSTSAKVRGLTHTCLKHFVSFVSAFTFLLSAASGLESFQRPVVCGKCSAALSCLSSMQNNVSGNLFHLLFFCCLFPL